MGQYPTKPIGIIVKDYEVESHFRNVLKTVTWRAGGTLVTFLVWVFVGRFGLAAQISLVDRVIKIGPFLHSRKPLEPRAFRAAKTAGVPDLRCY